MNLNLKMNKKGDIESIILFIAIIATLGIMLLIFNHLNYGIYTQFQDYFEQSPTLNDSEAHRTINEVIQVEESIWDYVFLGITFGYIIFLFVTSYSVRASPVFYFIYVFLFLFGLVLGATMSNVWQGFTESPEFAETILRFPMTDIILGNFYPLFITLIIVTSMILLFGKPEGASL